MTRLAKNSNGRAPAQGRAARYGLTFARDAISVGGVMHLTAEQRQARKDWLAGWRAREGQYAGVAGVASDNAPPQLIEPSVKLTNLYAEGDRADRAAWGVRSLLEELEKA